jgi:hypothetical protein
MEAMIERCAGLDVHQENVVACILYGALDKRPQRNPLKHFLLQRKGYCL